MKFWETDLELSQNLLKRAVDWHTMNFPNCRGSFKINNKCNHYRYFFDGCRCMKEIFEVMPDRLK